MPLPSLQLSVLSTQPLPPKVALATWLADDQAVLAATGEGDLVLIDEHGTRLVAMLPDPAALLISDVAGHRWSLVDRRGHWLIGDASGRVLWTGEAPAASLTSGALVAEQLVLLDVDGRLYSVSARSGIIEDVAEVGRPGALVASAHGLEVRRLGLRGTTSQRVGLRDGRFLSAEPWSASAPEVHVLVARSGFTLSTTDRAVRWWSPQSPGGSSILVSEPVVVDGVSDAEGGHIVAGSANGSVTVARVRGANTSAQAVVSGLGSGRAPVTAVAMGKSQPLFLASSGEATRLMAAKWGTSASRGDA